MSKFVDLLTNHLDNMQVEGNYATGQIDTDQKFSDFKAALKSFGYSFTIRSSRKESSYMDGKNLKEKTEHGKDRKNGEDGADGRDEKNEKNGKDGKDSKDEKDGKSGKNEKDGKDNKSGKDGKDNKNGKDGDDGKDEKDKKIGKDGKDSKEGQDGEEKKEKKEKKLPGRGSLMFKSSSDVSVPFFGLPFTVETTIYFTCSQGIKYYGSKQYPDEMFREGDPLSKKRRRPKLTQKIGCQARMTVKKIKVFTGEAYVVSKDNWREKKNAIDLLKKDLMDSKPLETVNRYCIVISLDASHNHEAKIKVPKRPKQSQYDPARKVLKLHEQFQDALVMLNSELVTKCTNISILTGCCNSLKSIINQLKDSIEKKDGVPLELITAAIDKITQKQIKSAAILERRNLAARKKQLKAEKVVKMEPADCGGNPNQVVTKMEGGEDNQVIELSNIIEGTQVIWDPVNVSWVPDGQIIVQDPMTGGAINQRTMKDSQPVLVQRRPEDGVIQNAIPDQNIGVIAQGGQNYTIVQHGPNVHLPNIGMSVPLTMAKVVHPTILTPNVKKGTKRNDVGVTAIAIPAGVEWNQQNWAPITQVVSSDGQFANFPTQTIWNITQ